MNKDNKKWGNLLYLILPAVLVLCIAYFTSSQNVVETKYYEVVNLFKTNQVTEYTVNLSSGALVYKVKGDNAEKKYTLPNVELFLADVHYEITEYNENNPESQAESNHTQSSGEISHSQGGCIRKGRPNGILVMGQQGKCI